MTDRRRGAPTTTTVSGESVATSRAAPLSPEPAATDTTSVDDSLRELASVRLEDVHWRVRARKKFGWILIILLLVQNAMLWAFVGALAITGSLADLAAVVITSIVTTLVETAAIVQIIVKWLFSDIDYRP